jgi:membrane-associated phospholipid phosphatase
MHQRQPCTLIVAVASLAVTLAATARAEQPHPSRPVELEPSIPATAWAFGASWQGELIPLGVSVGLLGGSLLVHQQHSSWGPDAAHAAVLKWDNYSNATVGAAVALGMAHYVLRAEVFHQAGLSTPSAYQYALPVLFSDVEALVIASSATNIIKKQAGRCRPRAWHDGVCDSNDDEEYRSFPSGHTTIPSALAGVHLVEAWREPNRIGNWISFGGIELAAVASGILRVKAGAHSWSDVGAGYAIGHLTGVMVALAHPRAELTNTPTEVRFTNPTFGFDGRSLTLRAAF